MRGPVLGALENRIVLIVEDEWLVRMELAGAFEDAAWEVLESATAEDAAALLRGEACIDVLITDIRLGGPMTGWDVAAVARTLRPSIAVIYVSANPASPGRDVTDSVFIDKPASARDVLNTASRLLRAAS